MNTDKEFVPYQQSLDMKELGFDEPCFGFYGGLSPLGDRYSWNTGGYNNNSDIGDSKNFHCTRPLYQQAINFLYICSNKQIDIQLKGSDTHEERIRKIEQGCKDLWNLQNNKSK
jgi:hypothetical protein